MPLPYSILIRMRLNNAIVEHSINTETDATHFHVWLEDGTLREVMRIDSCARVFMGDERYGEFSMDENHLWFYRHPDGHETLTGNKDLLKAEVKVFKELVEAGKIVL